MRIVSAEFGCQVIADKGDSLKQCDPARIVEMIRAFGWVHFRGFSVSVDDFERFADRFGVCSATRNVSLSAKALGFHTEDGYNPYQPDYLWFYCMSVGSGHGTPTCICDGVRLLRAMDPETRQFARESRVRYERQWLKETWQQVIGTKCAADLISALRMVPDIDYDLLDSGDLYIGYEVPIVQRTPAGEEAFANSLLQAATRPHIYGMSLANGTPVPEEFIREIEAIALRIEVAISWRLGEFAVLDNRRVMHRRGEYHGRGREIRVRHCESFLDSRLSGREAFQLKRLIQSEEGKPVRVGPPIPRGVLSPRGRGSTGVDV